MATALIKKPQLYSLQEDISAHNLCGYLNLGQTLSIPISRLSRTVPLPLLENQDVATISSSGEQPIMLFNEFTHHDALPFVLGSVTGLSAAPHICAPLMLKIDSS